MPRAIVYFASRLAYPAAGVAAGLAFRPSSGMSALGIVVAALLFGVFFARTVFVTAQADWRACRSLQLDWFLTVLSFTIALTLVRDDPPLILCISVWLTGALVNTWLTFTARAVETAEQQQ